MNLRFCNSMRFREEPAHLGGRTLWSRSVGGWITALLVMVFPRGKRLRQMSLLLVLTLCCAPPFVLPADATHGSAEDRGKPESNRKDPLDKHAVQLIEETIRRMTNIVRNRKGLSPVKPSSALRFVAQRHSEHMCRLRLLKHESDFYPQGWRRFMDRMDVARVRSGGENIAFHTVIKDPRRWALEVFKGWLRSPPHRKNLLEPRYTFLGVGISQCGGDVAYATQMFSAESGIVPKSADILLPVRRQKSQ